MKLNRSQPYGEVRGLTGLVGYEQGGRRFDHSGRLISDIPQPSPAPEPEALEPEAEPAAIPVALGGASEQPEMDDDDDGEDEPGAGG